MKGFFIGIFVFGVAGIVVCNLIQKYNSKTLKLDRVEPKDSNKKFEPIIIHKPINDNEVIDPQINAATIITERHEQAKVIISDAITNIFAEDSKNEVVISENESDFKEMFDKLDKLQK